MLLLVALVACRTPAPPPETGPSPGSPQPAPEQMPPIREALPPIDLDALRANTAFTVADLLAESKRVEGNGDLVNAAEIADIAVDRDPNSAEAHFQHGRLLARLHAGGQVCEAEATFAAVLDELKTSVKLDPAYASKLADPVFDEVRGFIGFRVLIGAVKADTANAPADLLSGATLYGPPAGPWGNTPNFTFRNAGEVAIKVLTATDPEPAWGTHRGTWTVTPEGHLLVRDGSEVYDLQFDAATGEVGLTQGVEQPESALGFSDTPVECAI